jgi:hypothetical protein
MKQGKKSKYRNNSMKSTREPTSSGGGLKKATSISENRRNSIINPSSNSSVTSPHEETKENEKRPHPPSLFDDEDDLKNIALSSIQLRNQIQLSLQKNPSASERNLFQNMTDEDLTGEYQQQQPQLIQYQIDPSQRKPIIKRINLLTGEGILEELEHEIQQTITTALDVCTRTLNNSKPTKESLAHKSSQGKSDYKATVKKKSKQKPPLAESRSPRSENLLVSSSSSQQDANIRRLTEKHSHYLQKILAQQKHALELISSTKQPALMNLGDSDPQLLRHLGPAAAAAPPQYQQQEILTASDHSPHRRVDQSMSLEPLPLYPHSHLSAHHHHSHSYDPHQKIKFCLHCDHPSPSESYEQSPYRYLEQYEVPQEPQHQAPAIVSPEPNWHSSQADAEKVKTQLLAEPLPKVPIGIDEKKLKQIAKERNIRLNTYDPSSGLFGVDKLRERFAFSSLI